MTPWEKHTSEKSMQLSADEQREMNDLSIVLMFTPSFQDSDPRFIRLCDLVQRSMLFGMSETEPREFDGLMKRVAR